MQVFRRAIEVNGGNPLPLGLYLQPSLEGSRAGVADTVPALSPVHSRIDRVSFFEAVLDDKYFATVAAFLIGGLSPNVKRAEDGATALHIAVSGTTKVSFASPLEEVGPVKNVFDPPCMNQLIISFLIDNGADVDAENNRGETPLMTAVAAQSMRAVKLLLAKGADLTRRDYSGHMVLHFAAPHPHVIQSLQVWIGSEELPRLAREEHLLHTVCRRTGTSLSALFLIEQLELDVNGVRPTAHAEGKGSATTAVRVGGGAASAAAGENGETPLHCAVRTGDVELVKALLSKGADPLKSDSVVNGGAGGVTPLQVAASLSTRRRGSNRKSTTGAGLLVNHVATHKLLRAFVAAAPNSRAREKLLGESSIQLWHVNGLPQWLLALAAGAGPHLVLAFACAVLSSFSLLMAVLVGLLFLMFQIRVTDEHVASTPLIPAAPAAKAALSAQVPVSGLPRRPLRTFGVFLGCLTAILWSLYVVCREYPAIAAAQVVSGNFSVVASLTDEVARSAHLNAVAQAEAHIGTLVRAVFLPLAVLTVGCLYVVVFKSPGTVSSTPGQRKGIYANILRAKGVPSKELLYSTDLATMTKKPLRAQHCPFVGRVILRYDHFSLHLASPIGARNYRAYVYGHLALCAWLLSMFMISSRWMEVLSMQTTIAVDAAFSTPRLRMAYLYTRVLLPVFILMSGFVVFQHVLTIRRNVSSFDIAHATNESSLYCFELGGSVYSLFDQGASENMKRFLLCRDALDEVSFRVPQMSAYLAAIVREHERWQLNPENSCGGGCGAEGENHGHSHGGGGVSDAGDASEVPVYEAGPDPRLVTAAERAQSQLQLMTGSAEPPPEKAASMPTVSDTVPVESATSLAYGLFQELIRHGGDPELFRTTQRAARTGLAANVNAELTPEDLQRQKEWDAAVAEAREMYRCFQDNMNNSMKRFVQERAHGDGDHGHSHGPAHEEAPAKAFVPVVESTFATSTKHD